jgi:hypothetical protein
LSFLWDNCSTTKAFENGEKIVFPLTGNLYVDYTAEILYREQCNPAIEENSVTGPGKERKLLLLSLNTPPELTSLPLGE